LRLQHVVIGRNKAATIGDSVAAFLPDVELISTRQIRVQSKVEEKPFQTEHCPKHYRLPFPPTLGGGGNGKRQCFVCFLHFGLHPTNPRLIAPTLGYGNRKTFHLPLS
jgi:hypothetical protein